MSPALFVSETNPVNWREQLEHIPDVQVPQQQGPGLAEAVEFLPVLAARRGAALVVEIVVHQVADRCDE